MEYLQKVKCKAKLVRRYKHDKAAAYGQSHKKIWIRRIMKFEGVIIGKRLLSDGFNDYTNESVIFEPEKSFVAFLVSINMKENPVYVLPEDLEELTEKKEIPQSIIELGESEPDGCSKEYNEISCDECEFKNYNMVGHPGGSRFHSTEEYYCEFGHWKDDF